MWMSFMFTVLLVEITLCIPNCTFTNSAFYSKLNYCYWIVYNPKIFSEAESECVRQGGHLAKIPNEDALIFIQNQTDSAIGDFWVGIETKDYTNFLYMDGESATFLPWLTTYTMSGKCVYLQTEIPYRYKDFLCDTYKIFMCYTEKEIMMSTETTTADVTTQRTDHIVTTNTATTFTITEPTNDAILTKATTEITTFVTTQIIAEHEITTSDTTTTNDQTTGLKTTSSHLKSTDKATISSTSTDKVTCVCDCNGKINISKKALQRRLEELVVLLTIPKKTTSASLRKLISAPDDRTSAKGIGYFGASILISVFGLVVLSDIVNIFMFKKGVTENV